MFKPLLIASIFLGVAGGNALSQTKIVVWNASPQLQESIQDRRQNLKKLNEELQPDVLILIEVAGQEEAKFLASSLGWPEYQMAVSDWAKMLTSVYFALETAVVSKLPIEQIIEFDPRLDDTHAVVDHTGAELPVPVSEEQADTGGISGINQLAGTDRVTMRVELENGLTVFPVHLKSNRNSICGLADNLNKNLRKLGLPENADIPAMLANGFEAATKANISNAMKRERVIAAVKLAADQAMEEGRDVLIAGDFNTSFEEGKVGTSFDDCTLQDFTCEKTPFPAAACSDGDSYDDTFAILTESFVCDAKWTILTSDLGPRTSDLGPRTSAAPMMTPPSPTVQSIT